MSSQHHDDHMKRVSFGPEDDIKLIVYDDGLTNSTETYNFHHSRRSTTPPDNTLNRVLVTSEELDNIPRPISPPTQLEDPTQQTTSPPLPSLIRKMEGEIDNPFRPDETLYHEVDPIVKAYSQRPFPPSPTGSPIPRDLTPIKNGRHVTLDNNSVTVIDGHIRSNTQSPISHHQQYHQNNSTTFDSTPKKHQQNGSQEMPPPNNVELVHVDNKKKKCACCRIQ